MKSCCKDVFDDRVAEKQARKNIVARLLRRFLSTIFGRSAKTAN